MNLTQMEYFSAVSKHNNITKASEELHISQPAITKSIRLLEEELGIPLLLREKNKISLTYEGEIFLEKSREILLQVDALVDEMRDYGQLRRKTVRVGIPATIGTLLLPRLNILVQEHFQTNLEILEDSSVATIQKVLDGKLDMAFVLLENDTYPSLDCEILADSSLHFCTNRNHPLASCDSIHPHLLENEQIIMYKPGALIMSLFQKYNITPKYLLYTNQVLTIQNYLKAGLASTFQFPEAFAGEEEIATVPLCDYMPLRLAMIKRKKTGNFRSVKEIYQFVKENKELFFQHNPKNI